MRLTLYTGALCEFSVVLDMMTLREDASAADFDCVSAQMTSGSPLETSRLTRGAILHQIIQAARKLKYASVRH